MTKKPTQPPLSEEDHEIFREAMKAIKPIKQDKIRLRKKLPKPIKRSPEREPESFLFTLSDHQTEETVQAQDKLFFVRSGVSPKQVQQLKQGKMVIAATLDLHGNNTESARELLTEFINEKYRNNKRWLRIVHGKGHGDEPVLKNRLNNWLRQIDQVLAFATATSRHGGGGALYVLLKSALK